MVFGDEIPLSMKKDEALVLFEFASRFTDTGRLELVHKAEERALWNLCAILEKTLIKSFSSGYKKILEEARQSLVAEDEQ